GHARGDDCLRAIAQALTSVTQRPADLAARYGGEEFGLLFPETDAAAARTLLGRLLANVHGLGIEHAASACGTSVTFSAGAVTLVPDRDGGAAKALECADRLLYEAKQNGRDRSVHLDLATGEKQQIPATESVDA
ncbi:MAG TPA: diguanylate cyclase, partial [Thermoanaerobaculia bacterium]